MSDKWTPGPWRNNLGVIVSNQPRGEWPTTAVAYVGEEWRHAGGLCYGEERDANARLIAAAPDLAEAAALQEAAEDANANCPECEGEGVPELCPRCFPLFDAARVKRRAALAKARGERNG